jgi:hypothetical protein
MLKPVNPSMCLLLAFIDVLYGIIVLIPGGDNDAYYAMLDSVFPFSSWVLPIIITGFILYYLITKKYIKWASRALAFNGVLWILISTYIFIGAFFGALWVPTLAIACYSLFISANFSVNNKQSTKDSLT